MNGYVGPGHKTTTSIKLFFLSVVCSFVAGFLFLFYLAFFFSSVHCGDGDDDTDGSVGRMTTDGRTVGTTLFYFISVFLFFFVLFRKNGVMTRAVE